MSVILVYLSSRIDFITDQSEKRNVLNYFRISNTASLTINRHLSEEIYGSGSGHLDVPTNTCKFYAMLRGNLIHQLLHSKWNSFKASIQKLNHSKKKIFKRSELMFFMISSSCAHNRYQCTSFITFHIRKVLAKSQCFQKSF